GFHEGVASDRLPIRRVAGDRAILAIGFDLPILDLLAPFVELGVVGDAALERDVRPLQRAGNLVDDQIPALAGNAVFDHLGLRIQPAHLAEDTFRDAVYFQIP